MTDKKEIPPLYGWDDGSIYFMDDNNKQWCVSEEKELYSQLVDFCTQYFKNKPPKENQKNE